MKPRPNESSLVVAGSWNRYIFTQRWVFNNLADESDVRMEFPVNDLALPYRYIFNGITFTPSSDRIILSPHDYEEISLEKANELAIIIVEMLPETPYKAFGINLSYVCDSKSQVIEDLNSILARSFTDTVTGLSIERQFRIDELCVLNLIITEFNDGAIVNFNYHHPLTRRLLAVDLKDKFVMYKNKSQEIMRNIYEEHLETEGPDEQK